MTAGGDAAVPASPKAATIISAVTGKEILAVIVASGEETDLSGRSANGNTSLKAFAKGGIHTNLANTAVKHQQ